MPVPHHADHEWEYQVSLVDRSDSSIEWVEDTTDLGATLKQAVAQCKTWAKQLARENNAKVEWFHASCLVQGCEHQEGDGDSL
jgi:hypothetical protein